MKTPVANVWFGRWLVKHQNWNRSSGWKFYESSSDDVYIPWMEAFDDRDVSEADASMASRRMAAEEPIHPERHLYRLLTIIGAIVADREPTLNLKSILTNRGTIDQPVFVAVLPTNRDEDKARQELAAQRVVALKSAWSALEPSEQQAYRDRVRRECPHVANRPQWLESLARTVWAEERYPTTRVNSHSVLDAWRLDPVVVPPEPVASSSTSIAPPALTREQEAALTARAAASRREQLARLRSPASAQTLAS